MFLLQKSFIRLAILLLGVVVVLNHINSKGRTKWNMSVKDYLLYQNEQELVGNGFHKKKVFSKSALNNFSNPQKAQPKKT